MGPPNPTLTRAESPDGAAVEVLARLDPWRLGAGAGVAIVGLGFLGGLNALGLPLGIFDLEAELSAPAFFSGLLLLAAAVCAFAVARHGLAGAGPDWAVALLGVVFLAMAVDEVAVVHENMDDWFGAENWIVAYLPVIALAAYAWLVTLRRLLASPTLGPPILFVAGAVAWGLAILIELPHQEGWNSRVAHVFVLPEEMLEMGGSLCFWLALLALIRARAARGEPATGAPAGPAPPAPGERARGRA
jgi:hypothetical protein